MAREKEMILSASAEPAARFDAKGSRGYRFAQGCFRDITMFGDDYILKIGHATENEAKVALSHLLYDQYGRTGVLDEGNLDQDGKEELDRLLKAVKNTASKECLGRKAVGAFSEEYAPYAESDFLLRAFKNTDDTDLARPATPDRARAFAAENPDLVKYYARKLSKEKKILLFDFLYREYLKKEGIDKNEGAAFLASAVTNKVFDERPTGDPGRTFAAANVELIEIHARELAADDRLAAVLTGAAYNACYARYVRAAGTRGIFSNSFLTYVRALSRWGDPSMVELCEKMRRKILELGESVLGPLESMNSLGIFRPLPNNPDERGHYEAVHQFAVEAGVRFKGS